MNITMVRCAISRRISKKSTKTETRVLRFFVVGDCENENLIPKIREMLKFKVCAEWYFNGAYYIPIKCEGE